MVALRRSRLPKGSEKKNGVWVSPAGKAYAEDGSGFVCKGTWKRKRKKSDTRPGKLTKENVEFIKGQLSAGASHTWLAEKFGVSSVTIHHISKGKVWADVKAPIAELEGPPKGAHNWRWDESLPYDEE